MSPRSGARRAAPVPAAARSPRVRRWRKVASGASLALVSSLLVVLAFRADGTPVTDVELHDGSVWVSNSQRLLIGRLNPQIKQLDLGVSTDSADVDIFQNGSTVFIDNQGDTRTLRQVDVARAVASDPVELPESVDAAFGGHTIALLDAESGQFWVRSSQNLTSFAAKTEPEVLKVGTDGAVAVSTSGVAYVLDRTSGVVTSFALAEDGTPEQQNTWEMGGSIGADAQLTVVGSTPVAYDPEQGRLYRSGSDSLVVDTEKPDAVRLQAPSAAGSTLYVGTHEGLLSGSPTGGDLEQLKQPAVAGDPAAPVVLDGCVHAAWADDGDAESYTRLCEGERAFHKAIPGVTASANLVFRVNRDVVVLNDTVSGDSWMVQKDSLDRVNNWDDVDPNTQRQELEKQEVEDPDEQPENRPPVANPDNLGARPGQATILPVVLNDTDPDRDLITITKVTHVSGPEPTSGYAVVGNDTQVQASFAADAVGDAVFRYDIADGRGGTASTEATITMRGASENLVPVKLPDRNTSLTVAQGQRNAAFVLADWLDPDGDDVTITAAVPTGEGQVEFRPDGTVEFIDTLGQVGQNGVEITVSDGRGGDVTAVVPVNVVAATSAVPEPVADRAVGIAGTKALVEPLLNDSNPTGVPLTLTDVGRVEGVEVVVDAIAGTFTATAQRPGTYYLPYTTANVDRSANSVVRLDVKAPSEANSAPVAVKDQGVLPAGGSVLVDVLANDYDPDEDVLVVQGAEVADGVPLKAVLLENSMLRVEATGDLTEPAQIEYIVSDGEETATGAVVISPGPLGENRAPVVNEDYQTLRAGSVATVSVLDNDSDPDGDELNLVQEDLVVDEATTEAGLLVFVSGDDLKVRAPQEPGQYSFTYGVRDARGVRVASTVWLTVKPDTPEGNSAPRPNPIVDRAIVGSTVRVPLNVQGADPDGDAVGFKSVVQAPQKGRIVATGADWVEYEPFEGESGTDVFSVTVADKYGASAPAEVRVGVIPQAPVNQAPVALNDELLVKPGKKIQFDPRLNDADPDGDPIDLLAELSVPAASDARVSGTFIEVTAPEASGGETTSTSVGYTITDGLGGTGNAFFVLSASEDAPFHAPIVRDDSADLAEVTGKKAGDTALVDVLENDGDLDGRLEDLDIEIVDEDVSRVAGRQLEVTLAAEDQVVAYKVVDDDDQIAYGFVFVSGTDSAPPTVNPEAVPLETAMNTPIEIELADVILVRDGRVPVLTTEDVITAQRSDGSPLVKEGEDDRVVFTPQADYVGPASVTVEVTDGDGLNDPEGKRSLLTIPIDVTPDGNVPPSMRTVRMLVSDTGEAARLDLVNAAKDANEDDELSFEVTSVEGPVEADMDGDTVIEVSAQDGAKPGDTATIDVVVDDGTVQVPGQVLVEISSSTRPPITVAPIRVDANAGEPVTIDVADYATNPYADDDEPLKLSNVEVENGDGSVSGTQGTEFTVTPKADSFGTVTVRFTVSDASGDSLRDVVGRATVTVAGRPEAPGRPQVTTTEARSVVLTWSAPNDRGAPITGYKVTGNGVNQECASTTCTITGLNPGDSYAFTVVAVNRIGDSDPSPASAPVTPDKMPDVMAPPQIAIQPTAMDGQLQLSWARPGNEGSEITSYEIKMVGSGQSQTVGGTATSYTWGGLVNGTTYQFQIRAINKTPTQQQFSPSSAAVAPFGVPAVMKAPVAEARNNGAGGGRTVRALWEPPNDNGDPIAGYRLVTYANGSVLRTEELPAGTVNRTYDGVENGVDYTFTIEAKNRAGWATSPSPRSNVVNPFGPASAPQITGKGSEDNAGNGGCSCVNIAFTTPSDNGGRPVTQYRAEWNGGSQTIAAPTQAEGAATQVRVNFGANRGPYTVTLTPLSAADGGSALAGARSNSLGGIAPYGPPNPPTGVQATKDGRNAINYSWSRPSSENGRPIAGYQYRVDGGSWSATTSQTSYRGTGYGQGTEHTIDVRAIDSVGGASQARSASATTDAPNPQVELYFENVGYNIGECSRPATQCKWIKFRVTDLEPNTNYTAKYDPSTNTFDPISFRTDGNGNYTYTTDYYYTGYNGQQMTIQINPGGPSRTQTIPN
ncbi:Ig-like domain-containing protein [Aeromicrobium sp. Leaf350]|uniref:Ig-like domain-containing protein n=1 Tax=Aeromicrobium sp. Leaf350 TaxID=2876565 RepID=UPI001E59C462|nr:Ig-like domain-containing protein [Aeromicrobium sp. Leaf350]